MKTIRFRLLIAALAVLLGTTLAYSQTEPEAQPSEAQPQAAPHGPEFGMRHMIQFFTKYLDLTDAQQAQAKSILEKEKPVLMPLIEQMHQFDQQLHPYEEGTYNEAKVRTLAAQQAQVEIELTVQKTRIHNELFQILTPDQQAKLKEFEANRDARMQQRLQQAAPSSQEQ
jgi:Spy/CpxP family protein refolding chaperone